VVGGKEKEKITKGEYDQNTLYMYKDSIMKSINSYKRGEVEGRRLS
jgi:dTDP-glucose pyrophosphorylase